jgi:hypothetical protein
MGKDDLTKEKEMIFVIILFLLILIFLYQEDHKNISDPGPWEEWDQYDENKKEDKS